jgi:hypothetical protein
MNTIRFLRVKKEWSYTSKPHVFITWYLVSTGDIRPYDKLTAEEVRPTSYRETTYVSRLGKDRKNGRKKFEFKTYRTRQAMKL